MLHLRRFLSTTPTRLNIRPAAAIAQHFETRVPEGDSVARQVCFNCGFIKYENPLVVVGAVITHQETQGSPTKILMCKRAIQPRYGKWTPPAGFMEKQETLEEGAKRESHEEAGADIRVGSLLGIYSIPHISQVHVFYRATLLPPKTPATPLFAAGTESLEVKLLEYGQIPWDDIAFPVAKHALTFWHEHQDDHAVQQLTLPKLSLNSM